MSKNIPIVVISCIRDLPMLALQAHSMSIYYNNWLPANLKKQDIYIIINESKKDEAEWYTTFNQLIKHWYEPFNLKILSRDDIPCSWSKWVPSQKNPWAVGWETQQILKFAIAQEFDTLGYLVLDSQNFLINSWSVDLYPTNDNRLPYRPSHFTMPLDMWYEYQTALGMEHSPPNDSTLNICTPVFFNTQLVRSLLETKSNLAEFSEWFRTSTRVKSEFTLYHLWAEKNGGIKKYHYECPSWSGYYLRDSRTFDIEFDNYIKDFRKNSFQAWSSINHRAWGDMSNEQYEFLHTKLDEIWLYGKYHNEYRNTYVNIQI